MKEVVRVRKRDVEFGRSPAHTKKEQSYTGHGLLLKINTVWERESDKKDETLLSPHCEYNWRTRNSSSKKHLFIQSRLTSVWRIVGVGVLRHTLLHCVHLSSPRGHMTKTDVLLHKYLTQNTPNSLGGKQTYITSVPKTKDTGACLYFLWEIPLC